MQINGSRDIREILKQGLAGTYDRNLYDRIRKNWDKVAKPLDSMGRFEDLTAKVGGDTGAGSILRLKRVRSLFSARIMGS